MGWADLVIVSRFDIWKSLGRAKLGAVDATAGPWRQMADSRPEADRIGGIPIARMRSGISIWQRILVGKTD